MEKYKEISQTNYVVKKASTKKDLLHEQSYVK